jgi:hypothetical protein
MQVLFRRLAALLAAPLFGGLLYASATAPAQADRLIAQWRPVVKFHIAITGRLSVSGGYLVYRGVEDNGTIFTTDKLATSRVRCLTATADDFHGYSITIYGVGENDVTTTDYTGYSETTNVIFLNDFVSVQSEQQVLTALKSAFHLPISKTCY